MPQVHLCVTDDVATALRERARERARGRRERGVDDDPPAEREPMLLRPLDANSFALVTGDPTEFARVPRLRVETRRA